jgi:hypothetical protein
MEDGKKKISRKRNIVIGCSSLIIIFICIIVFASTSATKNSTSETIETDEVSEPVSIDTQEVFEQIPTDTEDISDAVIEEVIETPTTNPTTTPENTDVIKPGTYIVGTDIQPGIYVGNAGFDLLGSCYWARLSNLSGNDNINANDNAEGLFYLEVLPTDIALETRCDITPIDKVPQRGEFLTNLPSGTYIIGRDIEVGIYKGEAGTDILETCYWARLSNVSGTNNILANDNAAGQFFIEVLPTDFALQVRCEVNKVE